MSIEENVLMMSKVFSILWIDMAMSLQAEMRNPSTFLYLQFMERIFE